MKMFENRSFAFLALLLFLFICGTLSCDCGDDDDDDSGSNSDDDDDDDDNDDDDNDDDDDDSSSNQVDEGVAAFYKHDYPPDPGVEINGVYFQQITGGEPGESGTSTVVGPDDTVYIAAEMGCLIYLYIYSPRTEQWSRRPVAYFALNPSLGIDSEGHLHLAYTDQYEFREKTEYSWNYKLVYATNKSGTWQHEMIDGEGDVGYDPCLVVDENDDVHISYLDAGNKALKYTTNRSGTWVTETVLPEGSDVGYGGESSLFIDDEGHAHISFTNDEGWYTGVYYATNKDGDWSAITIGSGYRSAIVVDHDGAVHIFFEKDFGFDTTIVQLGYATNRSGFWLSRVLDSTYYSGYYPSANVRDDGAIEVVYQSYNDVDYYLHYGVVSNGTWESQTTFGKKSYRQELSLAADSEGLFHVAYHVNYDLRTTTFDSLTSEFETESIEWSCGTRTTDNDIALDTSGQPHVSYSSTSLSNFYNINLYYGKRISGTWQLQRVDNEADSGYYSSITIDENDAAHIAYGKIITVSGNRQNYEYFLRYATNSSGQWIIQELTDIFRDYQLAIYLDEEGFVHIGYTGGSVDYITNQTGEWVISDVDSGNTIGSLFMDEEGRIYISYEKSCGVSYSMFSGDTWNQQYCVPNGDFIHGNSMAMDSEGNIHIAYSSDEGLHTGAEFYYATNESGDWDNYLLGTSLVNESINIKIHVDSQDHLHVICGSWLYGTDYITNASGEWTSSPIIPGYSGGSALDDDGNIHALLQRDSALWYVRFPQGIEN